MSRHREKPHRTGPPNRQPETGPAPAGSDRWRLAWLLLVACYLMFGFLYSVIQPLTALPDEAAHMEYVRFLSSGRGLPVWSASGRVEGGYETQHPPFSYALQSLPYLATGSLPENIRWHLVRWFMLGLGLLLLLVLSRMARLLYPDDRLSAYALAFTVQMMPLTMLYLCHANPDGVGLLVSATGLLLAFAIYRGSAEGGRLAIPAGAVAAAAALTKLSVMPVGVVLLAAQWFSRQGDPRLRRKRCGIILAIWLIAGGWWYLRNKLLYDSFFVHTTGKFGTGLDLAEKTGFLQPLWFTLKETYLSTWAQRGWFPAGLDLLLYAAIVIVCLLALAGLLKRARPSSPAAPEAPTVGRFHLLVSLALLAMVLFGQQIAFWTEDVELNAGGRYLLIALPAVGVLLVEGIRRLGPRLSRVALPLWVAAIVVFNVASVYNITNTLVPRYYPGWQMFEFPPGKQPW